MSVSTCICYASPLALFVQLVVLSHSNLFLFILFLLLFLKCPCFQVRDRKGVGLNRRGGGAERESVEGGETNQNILCEKSIFNKRRKEGICRPHACKHMHAHT